MGQEGSFEVPALISYQLDRKLTFYINKLLNIHRDHLTRNIQLTYGYGTSAYPFIQSSQQVLLDGFGLLLLRPQVPFWVARTASETRRALPTCSQREAVRPRGAESRPVERSSERAEGVNIRQPPQRTRASWARMPNRDGRLVGSRFGLLSFRPGSSITSVIPLQIEVHIPLHRRAQALHAFCTFAASRFAFLPNLFDLH